MTTNPFTDGRARTLNIVQRLKRCAGRRDDLVANRTLYNPPTTGPINGASRENTQEDTQ